MQLLCSPHEVHTEAGRHEIVLESGPTWSVRVGCRALQPLLEAERVLEEAATSLGTPLKALPCQFRAPPSNPALQRTRYARR
jgi:hypothetical protein